MKKLKHRKFLAWNEVAGEVIIIDSRYNKQVHSLNDVAATIWKLCDGVNERPDILTFLLELYDVPEVELAADLDDFIEKLLGKELLTYE